MADEAQLRVSLLINKSPILWQSNPQSFEIDVTGTKGPTPGAFTAVWRGTDVDLSQLVVPGLCTIQNLDDANTVHVGIFDPESLKFYPMMRVRPGNIWPLDLSDRLFAEYGSTGTGTAGPSTNTLRIVPEEADCEVVVSAFEE